jgi:hypothetical protein
MKARALGFLVITSVYAFTHNESAVCYASRYPDLHARFCTTDRCDTRALHDHYKNTGATEWRLWGCGASSRDAARKDASHSRDKFKCADARACEAEPRSDYAKTPCAASVSTERGARGTLIVWRPRWPDNFGETMQRLGSLAPALARARAASSPVTLVVPDSRNVKSDALPAFMEDLLRPLGAVACASATESRAFSKFEEVCAQKRDIPALRSTGILDKVLAHYGVTPRPKKGRGPRRVIFIDRKTSPHAPGRLILNLGDLVTRCRGLRGFSCDALDLGEGAFADRLRALRDADCLVGFHGAGIMNGAYMRAGSAVVEVFPETFAARLLPRKSKWANSHAELAALGLRVLRLHAPEVVRPTEAILARGDGSDALNTNITVPWAVLEKLLRTV